MAESAGDPDETVEQAMDRVAPEFWAWRARIDPDDEDDATLLRGSWRGCGKPTPPCWRGWRPRMSGRWSGRRWSSEGYLRDAALLARPWDFRVADVTCPTTLWVGEHDPEALAAVPWWRSHLSRGTVEVAPGTTHLATLLTQWPAILRRLAAATG